MLMPKRVKRRLVFRVKLKGKATRGNKINYGDYGLVALEPAWIPSNPIEAARVAISRYMKRGGKVWVCIFPQQPITKKPAETRMGSGKGSVDFWAAGVKPGTVLFQVGLTDEATAREALRLASYKLPVKTKFVKKGEEDLVFKHAQPVRKAAKEAVANTEVGGEV